MKNLKTIEKAAAEQYGSFRQFCIQTGQDPSNFKRKLLANLKKVNAWIALLGLKIKVTTKE